MNRRAADGSTRNRRHRLPLSAATPTVCKPAGKARRSRAVNTLTGKPTRDSQALEAEIAWLTTEIAQARAWLVTAQRGADEPFWQTPIGRSGFRSKASFYRMSRTYPPTESAIGRRRCGVAWANACQSSGHLLRAARVAIPSPSTDVSAELRRQPGVLDCRRGDRWRAHILDFRGDMCARISVFRALRARNQGPRIRRGECRDAAAIRPRGLTRSVRRQPPAYAPGRASTSPRRWCGHTSTALRLPTLHQTRYPAISSSNKQMPYPGGCLPSTVAVGYTSWHSKMPLSHQKAIAWADRRRRRTGRRPSRGAPRVSRRGTTRAGGAGGRIGG